MRPLFNPEPKLPSKLDTRLQWLQSRADHAKNASNPTQLDNKRSEILIAEVVDPSQYGMPTVGAGYAYCRLLSGTAMTPVDDLCFHAQLTSASTYPVGTKVFVLIMDASANPLIMGAFASGAGVVALTAHSHQGAWDGGWMGAFAGSI